MTPLDYVLAALLPLGIVGISLRAHSLGRRRGVDRIAREAHTFGTEVRADVDTWARRSRHPAFLAEPVPADLVALPRSTADYLRRLAVDLAEDYRRAGYDDGAERVAPLLDLAEDLDHGADVLDASAHAARRRRALAALHAARAARVGSLTPRLVRRVRLLLAVAVVALAPAVRRPDHVPRAGALDRLPPSTRPRSGLSSRVFVPRARLAFRAIPTGPPV